MRTYSALYLASTSSASVRWCCSAVVVIDGSPSLVLPDGTDLTRSDEVAPLPSLLARQPQEAARYVSGMPAPVRRYACGMGKTSVYLSDELIIRWHASSLPLSEVVRRGLDAIEGTPDLVTEVRRAIREELAGVSLAADRSQARYEPDSYSSEPFEDSA